MLLKHLFSRHRGRGPGRGRDHIQSVHITTKVVGSNTAHDEVYSIHYYVIKFVSDFRQVGGFSLGTPISSTNKIDRHDIAEILLKVVLNTITLFKLHQYT